MNQQTKNITVWLEDNSILNTIENHLKSNPDYSHVANNISVRLDDSVELFNYLKEIVLQAIATGVFEKLPTTIQLNIHNQVQAVHQQRTNVGQFIIQIQSFYHHVLVAGLEQKLDSYDNFKRALTDIANLRRSYSRSVSGLDDLVKKVEVIDKNYNKAVKLIDSFIEKKREVELNLNGANQDLASSKEITKEIKQYQQEIQNSKKEILAFNANIESYKLDIEKNTSKAEHIIKSFKDQQTNVDSLINDAEQALQLKSSEGISAALSTQYIEENRAIKKVSWIIAASVFVLFALTGVLFLLFDFEFEKFKMVNNGINSVVARVVFVGISISGATFCANQYNKQKLIADDYGYKLVLAKSILAFLKEIKRHNPDKAADYIKDVLDEINRSPVHKSKDEGLTKADVGLFQQIHDMMLKNK